MNKKMTRDESGCRQGSVTVLTLIIVLIVLMLAALVVNTAVAEKKMAHYYYQDLQARQSLDAAIEWVLASLRLQLEQNSTEAKLPSKPITAGSKIYLDGDNANIYFVIESPGVELYQTNNGWDYANYCWYKFKATGRAYDAVISAEALVRFAYTDHYQLNEDLEPVFSHRVIADKGRVVEYKK